MSSSLAYAECEDQMSKQCGVEVPVIGRAADFSERHTPRIARHVFETVIGEDNLLLNASTSTAQYYATVESSANVSVDDVEPNKTQLKLCTQSTSGFASFATPNPLPALASGPLIPGDPEREAPAIRIKEGIPLLKPVVDDLLDISQRQEFRLRPSDSRSSRTGFRSPRYPARAALPHVLINTIG